MMKSSYTYFPAQRDWLRATGPDALRFLNGMWTADLQLACRDPSRLPATGGAYLLDLKGRPISPAVFMALSSTEFVFSVPQSCGEPLLQALDRYLVADDVQLELCPDFAQVREIPSGLGGEAVASHQISPLVPADLSRLFRATPLPFGFCLPRGLLGSHHEELWIVKEEALIAQGDQGEVLPFQEKIRLRIEKGLPEWGRDYGTDSLILEFPHDQEISFYKGCYIGQEVVARATYRGRMVKGFCRFTGETPLREDFVYAHALTEKPVAKITSALEKRGLGLLRLRALEEGGGLYQIGPDGSKNSVRAEIL